jgi:hypothetical protein
MFVRAYRISLCIGLAVHVLIAEQTPHTAPVTVLVTDMKSYPIRDARIVTHRLSDEKRQEIQTDSGGKVSIGLEQGNYRMSGMASGFSTSTIPLEVHDLKPQTIKVALQIGPVVNPILMEDLRLQLQYQDVESTIPLAPMTSPSAPTILEKSLSPSKHNRK